jgi:diketogulonate reductase-like aldo/keto reductase
MNHRWNRRELMKLTAALGLAPLRSMAADTAMIERRIPVSGEALPVVGLGTYDVFDVDSTPANIEERATIIELLVKNGGSLVDTSPMYNRSEKVIGDVIATRNNRRQLFIATKVWTDGKADGERQMARSAELMNTDIIDLMQVHNLRDLESHLVTIRDWQAEKRIRYSGVTHYRADAHDDLERVIESQKPDFIQINYSLGERGAADRLLPAAEGAGVAVLVNRPFVAGQLFSAVRGSDLPAWAGDIASSWGQFFLKYIISHPAITCVIPATSKPHHMADNLQAGFGALPDSAMRKRMEDFVDAL